MSLTPVEAASAFDEHGFAGPITVVSESEARSHYARLQAFEAGSGPLHYRVKPYLVFSSAFEIATHPALLDAVEAILGPDILLWDAAFIVKEPHSEGYISWHQDMTYWGLATDSDDDLVSAWVAYTPAHRRNGCMQFVRGTHHGPHFDHRDTYDEHNLLHRGQVIEAPFAEDRIVHLELKEGQCSLHHGWAVHSSHPNRSDTRRVGLAINYTKPSVRQTVTQGESASVVRGQDRFGHFRPEPLCGQDNVAENVAFQLEAERLKRETYDKA